MKLKKFFSVMLSLIMIVSMIPQSVFADDTQEESTFTVIFQDYNGNVLDKKDVQAGERADDSVAKAKAIREGYTFTEWDQIITNVQKSFITHAQYKRNEYKVNFYSDENRTYKFGSEQTVYYGDAAKEPKDAQKEGNILQWKRIGTDDVVDISEIKDNYELYADYIPNKYNVNFYNLDGYVMKTIQVEYDNTVSNKPEAPKKAGYDVTWDMDFTEPITCDRDVVPKLDEHKYMIRFDEKGGKYTPDEQMVYYTENTVMPMVEKDGYRLSNWNTDANGKGKAYLPGVSYNKITEENYNQVTGAGIITLYAIWVPKNDYMVRYQTNCEEKLAPMTKVAYDGTNLLPEAISKEGYTLAGWYDREGEGAKKVENSTKYCEIAGTSSSIVLYAKWLVNHTVTFDTKDGRKATTEEVADGRLLGEPTEPTRVGWIFSGWYTDGACITPYNFETPVTEDITLYAKWTERHVSVIFMSNGVQYTSEQVQQGQAAPKPADPTIPPTYGKGFIGWCTTPEGGTDKLYDFKKPVMENITLYAWWGEQTSISDARVTVEGDFQYTGQEIRPDGLTVILGGTTVLKPDKDYVIKEYANNINPSSSSKDKVPTVTIEGKGMYKDTASGTFTISDPVMSKVTSVTVKSTTGTAATIGWKAQTGVMGYKVYVGTECKLTVKGATKTSGTVSKLLAGKAYNFQVRAYIDAGMTYTSEASAKVVGVTVPAKVAISKVTTKSKTVTVTWGKKTCTKYEVQLATNKTFTKGLKKTTAKATATTATIKSLKKGTTYYVRVRAVATSGKIIKNGAWSLVKNVKCK